MLPVINTPEFETVLPSNGKMVKYRPFLVKEEKVLYMALEGGDVGEIANAVTNVLNACTGDAVKVDELPFFDVEHLFLRLRGKSVGEMVQLNFRHTEGDCKHITPYEINLEDVQVEKSTGHDYKIQLTPEVGVLMKYPTLKTQGKIQTVANLNDLDKLLEFLADSIDKVYDNSNVYENFTNQDAKKFIEGLNKQQFEKLMDFFATMPRLRHEVSYTCPKCGKEENITLEGLASFFG